MSNLFDLQIRDHLMNKNFNQGRTQKIRQIVIHHNAGHGVDPWQTWQTREASAHYQVWGNGTVDKLVDPLNTAWHANEANPWTIGIEHENESGAPEWKIADKGLHASAKLVGYLCAVYGLGSPTYRGNITTHYAIERDGVGTDTHTACPGPYFLTILDTPSSWYWKEAKQAYTNAMNAGGKPKPPSPPPSTKKLYQGASVPALIRQGSGQYLGSISGPANSHGGYVASEKSIVSMLQQRLIVCGFVPGHSNPSDGWADGIFDTPADAPGTGATSQAVKRFQQKYMPGTQFFGQIWYDDWTKLFNL